MVWTIHRTQLSSTGRKNIEKALMVDWTIPLWVELIKVINFFHTMASTTGQSNGTNEQYST